MCASKRTDILLYLLFLHNLIVRDYDSFTNGYVGVDMHNLCY